MFDGSSDDVGGVTVAAEVDGPLTAHDALVETAMTVLVLVMV